MGGLPGVPLAGDNTPEKHRAPRFTKVVKNSGSPDLIIPEMVCPQIRRAC